MLFNNNQSSQLQIPHFYLIYNYLNLLGTINLNVGNLSRLIGHSHLSSKSAVWDPLSTGHWCRLLQHSVDLFKSKTLGLWDQEIGVDEAECAERSPEEEDLWSKINTTACSGGDVWSDDGDDLVPLAVFRGIDRRINLRSSIASWKRWREQHHGI